MWLSHIILMHISCFFFANDLLLAIYFIFTWDYGNDVRQNANSNSFLVCIQNWSWSSETTRNIHNVFVPGTANEPTVQWWFKKFCKGDESLEDEECNGQSMEVDNDQMKASLKLILLQLHEKLPKNSTILWSIGIWSKLGRWKSSVSGCLMSRLKTKILLFWSVVFSYSTQQQWTVSWSDCEVWW